ncbi:hypothetical protein F3J28_20150 [Enterobacter sp. Ap-1006]|nr:hypothetical protein [Enterobacter sp. Ap-1006]
MQKTPAPLANPSFCHLFNQLFYAPTVRVERLEVLNCLKVYYHRHNTNEPRTTPARKGIKSLCVVKC